MNEPNGNESSNDMPVPVVASAVVVPVMTDVVVATAVNNSSSNHDEEVPVVQLTGPSVYTPEEEEEDPELGLSSTETPPSNLPVAENILSDPRHDDDDNSDGDDASSRYHYQQDDASEVYGGSSTRQLNFSETRAEFISATFYKAHDEASLGIDLEYRSTGADRTVTTIAAIQNGSLAHDSPLRVGDIVVSVNGKPVVCPAGSSADSSHKQETLEHDLALPFQTVGSILHLVVHNTHNGIPDLVESMVMKTKPHQKMGLKIRYQRGSGSSSSSVPIKNIVVSRLEQGHPFLDHSLLNPNDILLSINGKACGSELKTPKAVAQWIDRSSPVSVTILARTWRDTGAVVAELSSRHLRNGSRPVLLGSLRSCSTTENETSVVSTANNHEALTEATQNTNRMFCAFLIVLLGFMAVSAFT